MQGKRDGDEHDAEADDEGPDTGIPVGVSVCFPVMRIVRHIFSLCSCAGRRRKSCPNGCQLFNVKT
jgi:hypothetical protein